MVKLILQHKTKTGFERGVLDDALYDASSEGHTDVVRLLLEYNASADARRSRALSAAAASDHIDIVRLLLANGAEIRDPEILRYCNDTTARLIVNWAKGKNESDSESEEEEEPDFRCLAKTKKGENCRATPVKNSHYCGIHKKQIETQDEEHKNTPPQGRIRCNAITKKGEECKNSALQGSAFCGIHRRNNQ
jgi:hypothetical protein